MTSARRFYLLPLGLGLFGVVLSVVGLGTAVGSLDFELAAAPALAEACRRLVPVAGDAASVSVLLLAALGTAVLVRGCGSVFRLWRLQRRFRRGLLPAGDGMVAGTPVRWIDEPQALAFCAGLVRPRIYLSLGARGSMSREQLEAVVAHERHHVLRRDPLRVLVVSALAQSLFFMPALRRLAERYSALAEIAADEAAARARGGRALASAMLAFGRSDDSHSVIGVAPERVDQLLGHAPEWRVKADVLSTTVLALVGVVGLAVAAGGLAGPAGVDLTEVAMSLCRISLLALPLLALAASASQMRRRLRVRRGH